MSLQHALLTLSFSFSFCCSFSFMYFCIFWFAIITFFFVNYFMLNYVWNFISWAASPCSNSGYLSVSLFSPSSYVSVLQICEHAKWSWKPRLWRWCCWIQVQLFSFNILMIECTYCPDPVNALEGFKIFNTCIIKSKWHENYSKLMEIFCIILIITLG